MAFGYVHPPDPLHIDGIPVLWVPRFTYLGMLTDSRLSSKPCIASLR